MKKLLFIFLAYSLLTSCNTNKEKIRLLKGKVFDEKTKTIIICKTNEFIDDGQGIEIPVQEDGSFEYTFRNEFIETYLLVSKEGYENGMPPPEPIIFLTYSDKIEIELYSNEKTKPLWT